MQYKLYAVQISGGGPYNVVDLREFSMSNAVTSANNGSSHDTCALKSTTLVSRHCPQYLFNQPINDRLGRLGASSYALLRLIPLMEKSARMPARYYPLFLAVEGRTCLVVGAGAVASARSGHCSNMGPKYGLSAVNSRHGSRRSALKNW